MNRKSAMRRILINHLLALAIYFLPAGPLYAERLYIASASFNLIASMDNNPQVLGLSLRQTSVADNLIPSYAAYPSIFLTSTGPHSSFNVSYAFGYNRIESPLLDLDFQSHSVGLDWTANLTKNLQVTLSESFTRSPDFATTNLFRGLIFTEEGIFFDFETIALRRNGYSSGAGFNLDYTISPRSSLGFQLGHSLRKFGESPALEDQVVGPDPFRNRLSDQSGYHGSLRYGRTSGRTDWGFSYSVYQYDFREFHSARTHNAVLDFSRQITPTTSFGLSAGPSYTEALGGMHRNFPGYTASLKVSQSLEDNHFSFSYLRRSGTSSGLGSISDTDRIALNFSRPLGRRTNFSTSLSGYRTRRRLDNPVETEGVSVASILSFTLSTNWALSFGGSFQKQDAGDASGFADPFDLERTRAFVSLSFLLPEFVRFER